MKSKSVWAALLLLSLSPLVVLSGCSASRPGIVLPAYFYPAGDSADAGLGARAWRRVEAAARQLGPKLVVIANPNSGPGERVDPQYREVIAHVQSHGARVVGYVSTRWGQREAEAVRRDVDAWYELYRPDGIFFDEAATKREDGGVDLAGRYSAYVAHAEAAQNAARPSLHAPACTVLNFGAVPDPAYLAIPRSLFVALEERFAVFAAAPAPGMHELEGRLVALVHERRGQGAHSHMSEVISKSRADGYGWLCYCDHDGVDWSRLADDFEELVGACR